MEDSHKIDEVPLLPPCSQTEASARPAELQPWQKRWNLEWLRDAYIPDYRRRIKYCMQRHPSNKKLKKHAADNEAVLAVYEQRLGFSSQADSDFPTSATVQEDKKRGGKFKRAVRRVMSPLEKAKEECSDFLEWRRQHREQRQRKDDKDFDEGDGIWWVEAVMEDQGENPKWQGELTMRIRPEHYAELVGHQRKEARATTWFDFPTPDNIKWFHVTKPDGLHRVMGATRERHWGPDSYKGLMPFKGQSAGRIVRNVAMLSPEGEEGLLDSFPPLPTVSAG